MKGPDKAVYTGNSMSGMFVFDTEDEDDPSILWSYDDDGLEITYSPNGEGYTFHMEKQ